MTCGCSDELIRFEVKSSVAGTDPNANVNITTQPLSEAAYPSLSLGLAPTMAHGATQAHSRKMWLGVQSDPSQNATN